MSSRTQLIVSVLLLGATAIHAAPNTTSPATQDEQGVCECAPFSNKDLNKTREGEPFYVHTLGVTSCDEGGEKLCLNQCLVWARTKKLDPNTPIQMCESFVSTDHAVKPALFTRVCDGHWAYSGMVAEVDLCCKEGSRVACSP